MAEYIENGGGWIGIHGAGDASSDWDWYEQTLIGFAPGHTAESFAEPEYVGILESAVAWTAGLEGADCHGAG